MIAPPDSAEPNAAPVRRSHRWRWIGGVLAGLCVAIGVLVFLWDWNWFRPLVEARASAAIGRQVTMEQLEVHPGRSTVVVAHGVRIANPTGFDGPEFASLPRLAITFDLANWIRTRRVVLPLVELDQPIFNVEQTEAGQNNWTLTLPAPDPNAPPAVDIGDVVVKDGTAHVVVPKMKAKVDLGIATGQSGDQRTLIVEGKGSYAAQPIIARLVGGALLTLRDANTPYPVDFSLANGNTRITLKGTIRNPLALAGADLNLVLSGQDMEQLYPLIGIATPKTPPYRVSGKLDFGDGRIKFTEISGKVGNSDLGGALEVDPHGARPVLSGNLHSRLVDMEDLGGFIGSQPGRTTTPGQTAQQVEEVRRAEASPKLLPTTPISVPKIKAADIHIVYQGDKIQGKNVPFDTFMAKLDIDDGRIRLTPLRLGIGGGALVGTLDLNPVGDELDADAAVKIEHINISKLLAAAGLGSGQGTIDGTARLKGRGASLSAIVGHGDGALRAVMPLGGDVNSLLVDLSGLEVGPAILAALGIPNKERIRCMVVDLVLQQGILATRTLVLDTSDHIVSGGGRVDLLREVLDMRVRTDSKHFTIGKLATPIHISGPLKKLSFAPDAELAIRGGAVIGLGLLFPAAAILPTIQFGVGEGSPCAPAKK